MDEPNNYRENPSQSSYRDIPWAEFVCPFSGKDNVRLVNALFIAFRQGAALYAFSGWLSPHEVRQEPPVSGSGVFSVLTKHFEVLFFEM